MIEFIQSISENELEFIAGLDYGQESERHYAALKEVIFNQSCKVTDKQCWFPLEVIELGSYSLQQGHEKEFTICTLLVLLNNPEDVNYNFENGASNYDLLPNKFKKLILDTYVAIGN
ncbi:MAG: hypothetical protein GY787_26485 [Alteromonadales bacterium]|nr:hypothetical protein [Alteromonadales bacterium]